MQQTIEEKFREEFPEAKEWQSEHQEEPCGLIDGDEACLLVYDDVEKFGLVPISSLCYEPEFFNYSISVVKEKKIQGAWAMKGRNSKDFHYATFYYQDDYIQKVAKILNVTPSGLQDYAYSNFEYSEYPAKFQKDEVRILVAPYIINS